MIFSNSTAKRYGKGINMDSPYIKKNSLKPSVTPVRVRRGRYYMLSAKELIDEAPIQKYSTKFLESIVSIKT